MQPTKKLRFLLVLSGLLAMAIGAALLFAPVQFHATNGIQTGTNANLLSLMFSPSEISMLTATVGSGLIAGLCFAFGSFVMTSFDRLGAPEAIRAMQAINATILRSSAMAVWFGTAVVGVAAAVLAENRTPAIVAAALYGIGAILITGRGNVPLNDELDHVDPDEPGGEEVWRRYRVRWGRWNALRTAMLTLATAAFALAR